MADNPVELRTLRTQLNEFADLLHRDVPGRDYSPFEVISRIVGFIGKGARPPTVGKQGASVHGANEPTEASIDDAAPDEAVGPDDAPPAAAPQIEVPAYRRAEVPAPVGGEPHDAPTAVLVEMVVRIVEIEGPIHADEIARRIAAGFGKSKAGGRIQKVATAALDGARRKGGIVVLQDFWMTLAQQASPPVRNRAAESAPTTKAIHICPLEIRAAAALISKESGNVATDEMIRSIARLLGFQRVGGDLQVQIGNAMQA